MGSSIMQEPNPLIVLGALFKADPEKPLAAALLLVPVLVFIFFVIIFGIFLTIIGL
jgi:hypothetical protein